MWLPIALTVGFALVFLALHLTERRYAREEADEGKAEVEGVRQVDGRRGPAGDAPVERDAPQPAPIRSQPVPLGVTLGRGKGSGGTAERTGTAPPSDAGGGG